MQLLDERTMYKYGGAIAGICLAFFVAKSGAGFALPPSDEPSLALHRLNTYWAPPVWGILAILWITGIGLTIRATLAIYGLVKEKRFKWTYALFLNVALPLALLVAAVVFTGTGTRDFHTELCRYGLRGQAELFPFLPRSVERFYLIRFPPVCENGQ